MPMDETSVHWIDDLEVAAEQVIQNINSDTNILPGYNLRISWIFTECDTNIVVQTTLDAVMLSTKVAILGVACPSCTEAYLTVTQYFNLVQIETRSTSPVVVNHDKYPLFVRMVGSDVLHNVARSKICRHFGWDQIAAVYEDDWHIDNVIEDVVNEYKAENITVRLTLTERREDDNPQGIINQLMEMDARVIAYDGSPEYATKLFCQAYMDNLYGSNYVWLLREDLVQDIIATENTNDSCIKTDILQVIENAILTTTNDHTPRQTGGLQDSDVVLDGIWSIALALNKVSTNLEQRTKEDHGFRNNNFTYGDPEMANMLHQELAKLQFTGKTGDVSFDDDGERKLPVTIFQIQNSEIVKTAVYDPMDGITIIEGEDFRWKGNQVPKDSRDVFTKIRYLYFPLVLAFDCLSLVGILFTIVLALVYCSFRKRYPVQKTDDFSYNYIVILGCFLTFVAVILHGIDGTIADKYMLTILCKSDITKTYYILTFMVIIDMGILLSWELLDPHMLKRKHFDKEDFMDETIKTVTIICHSEFRLYWTAALYAYKGIQIILGSVYAYESSLCVISRRMQETRNIRALLYIIGLISSIGALIVLLLEQYPYIAYYVTAGFASSSAIIALIAMCSKEIVTLLPRTLTGARKSMKFVKREGAMKRTRTKSERSSVSISSDYKASRHWSDVSLATVSQNAVYLGSIAEGTNKSELFRKRDGSIFMHTRENTNDDKVFKLQQELKRLRQQLEITDAEGDDTDAKTEAETDEVPKLAVPELGREIPKSPTTCRKLLLSVEAQLSCEMSNVREVEVDEDVDFIKQSGYTNDKPPVVVKVTESSDDQ
ncbi:gamma-aminobutyric acid type B receptor subunit 2-like [Glandiceps talaboti]